MKSVVLVLVGAVIGFGIGLVFMLYAKSPSQSKRPMSIAILTPLSHPSLDESIRGFRAQLAAAGFTDERVVYTVYNAQGEMSKLPSMIDSIVQSKPSLVFCLTTPAAMQAVKTIPINGIPLVFTAVTDPQGAGIVNRLDRSTLPVTGVSDRYPVAEQMKFLKSLLPGISSVGILRNPAEQNSKLLSEESKKELERLGVSSTLIDVNSEEEIVAKTQQAMAQHKCLLVNGDNLLVANLGRVIKLCSDAKTPLYVGDPDSVRKGALAAVGPSYYSLGEQAGKQAQAILSGKPAGSLPVEFPTKFDYIINTSAAEAMGVTIPIQALRTRAIWESRSGS